MSKSWGDWVSDQIGMLPLHLTGITAMAKACEVAVDVVEGKTPKISDVVSAAGVADLEGLEEIGGTTED